MQISDVLRYAYVALRWVCHSESLCFFLNICIILKLKILCLKMSESQLALLAKYVYAKKELISSVSIGLRVLIEETYREKSQ